MVTSILPIDSLINKVTPILEDYPIKKAILFGSYATGNPGENSDVDLYIDSNGQLKGLDFVGLLELLANSLELDIDLIDKSHIEEGSRIMQEIENKGMVIYERANNHSENN